ncbi:hypothetical protein D9757_011802 [Collybiopsis confluens]|uniref:Uncharacterized protein n=1 Tax=Collybiopsis confluens TaxID=2823264 RepID=A0A8H5G3F9_9AGAR|nr:hypothetical protein D9757_013016 [Collybiopsis confluens]KAF5364555.1 hypothetical protein D9757_011802 [Collybiopsis confluens]
MSLTMLNLDDTLGAAFIGYTVSCIIFGVFTMQSISYFVNYRADSWSLKMLVGFTWCAKILSTTSKKHTYLTTTGSYPMHYTTTASRSRDRGADRFKVKNILDLAKIKASAYDARPSTFQYMAVYFVLAKSNPLPENL